MFSSIVAETKFVIRACAYDDLIHPSHAASTYPGLTIAQQGDWEACVRGSTAVVNLAGMPISTRWSPEVRSICSNLQSAVDT
jgi:hypothetical protein